MSMTTTIVAVAGPGWATTALNGLGWMLLHSLWQFTAIGLLSWSCLSILRRRPAPLRYAVGLATLAAMVLVSMLTWALAIPSPRSVVPMEPSNTTTAQATSAPKPQVEPQRPPVPINPAPTSLPITGADRPSDRPAVDAGNRHILAHGAEWKAGLISTVRPWLPWIVFAWLIGVATFSVRTLVSWSSLQRLRSIGTSPAPPALTNALRDALERAGVTRHVALQESTRVDVPVVFGARRPLILVPTGIDDRLSRDQIDALLDHEVAHLKRQDYLVNLAQVIVETLFFHHPAIWWISNQIRIEREHCCDDQATTACGDRVRYVESLLAMERTRPSHATPRPALSSGGVTLLARVQRLTLGDPAPNRWSPVGGLLATTILVVAVGAGSIAPSVASPSVDPSPETNGETTPMDDESPWGDPMNGLRSRVVPVNSAMSEETVELDEALLRSRGLDEIAFAIELENVSDVPIELLDTRYGSSYGEAAGRAASDHFSPYLFTIDYFNDEGRPVARPDVQVIDLNLLLDGAQVTTIAPGQTHRFLIRPAKWLRILSQRLEPGTYRARVAYHGMPERVRNEIQRYRPDSDALDAWTGTVEATSPSFEIEANGERPDDRLAWGAENDGLRAAIELAPAKSNYDYGEKPDVIIHIENVDDRPITFFTPLWVSEVPMTVEDARRDPVDLETRFYTGWTLSGRVTLQPGRTVAIDAGNLAIASSQEQADTFEHVTWRMLVATTGTYRLRLTYRVGGIVQLRDDDGNVLAPTEEDWKGDLETGPLEVAITRPPDDR